MKDWQFWLLLAMIGVTLIIVIKIGQGLQQAQASVSKITNPIQNLLSTFGL